jgi:hypothetical protein
VIDDSCLFFAKVQAARLARGHPYLCQIAEVPPSQLILPLVLTFTTAPFLSRPVPTGIRSASRILISDDVVVVCPTLSEVLRYFLPSDQNFQVTIFVSAVANY